MSFRSILVQIFYSFTIWKNVLFSHIVSVLLKTVLILCKYFLSFTSSLYLFCKQVLSCANISCFLQMVYVCCKYFLLFTSILVQIFSLLQLENISCLLQMVNIWCKSSVLCKYCKGHFSFAKVFALVVFRTANFAHCRSLTAQCCLCAKTQSVSKFYSVSKPCVFCRAKHRQNAFCR